MALMATKIIKYLRIYWKLIKFAAIADTTYRTSFFMMILVEALYIFVVFLSIKVIYSNIVTLAGWDYYRMIIFTGVYSIFSELLLGVVFIHNLRNLPSKVVNGELDLILTKPIDSQFAVSLWRPYFALLPSLIPGLLAIVWGIKNTGITFNVWSIPPFLFLFFCGQIIAYSIGLMISTLSFFLIGADPLPNLAEEILFMAGKPYSIYFGFWRIIFLAIIPLAFMVNFPARALLGETQLWWFPAAIILSIIFFKLSRVFWNFSLKRYTIASS